jgi:hypothetical protein
MGVKKGKKEKEGDGELEGDDRDALKGDVAAQLRELGFAAAGPGGGGVCQSVKTEFLALLLVLCLVSQQSTHGLHRSQL